VSTLEHGDHIPDDEPVIVFRAQDKTTIHLLDYYTTLCTLAGSPQRHLDLIARTRQDFTDWQHRNETKVPGSETP
jgi:hypothetical protein